MLTAVECSADRLIATLSLKEPDVTCTPTDVAPVLFYGRTCNCPASLEAARGLCTASQRAVFPLNMWKILGHKLIYYYKNVFF